MSTPLHGSPRPYLAKLERRQRLSPAAAAAFAGIPSQLRVYEANQYVVSEGDRPKQCRFVQSGLVSRYKTLRNGSRQIVSFHIAGDMVDLQSVLTQLADDGVQTHTRTELVAIDHGDILRLIEDFPEIGRALWFDTLVDAGIFREWTVNVGRRDARERTAHLLLEFAWRLNAAGLMDGDSFELPINQVDMSDALGISPVHLNRTLQWLRAARLIHTHSRTIILQDREGLVRLSGFSPEYLHPEGPRQL